MEKLKKILDKRKETYVEKTPKDVYREVAGKSDKLSTEDIAGIGGVESQHGKYNKPLKGGVAEGLFQFQPATAEHLEPGSSKTLNDINTQSSLMSKYLEKNKQENPESAYAMHNLGPTRGSKFNNADDSELVSNVIPSYVIRANPGLYKVKTVGEARELIRKKLKAGEKSADLNPEFMDLFKENKNG